MTDVKKRIAGFKYDYLGLDVPSIKDSLTNRLAYSVGKDPLSATPRDWFHALAITVRDRLIERRTRTMRTYYRKDAKRVYYLSLEFLMGRALTNSMMNLDIQDECRQGLLELGHDLEAIRELEEDAALGNGGLGRLAACFLDSLATLRMPGYGYGIRYEYGMFNQRIDDGNQVEHPENWLRYGNPWEFPRPEVLFPVKFYGRTVDFCDDRGQCHHWVDSQDVMAMAYDIPIPGYATNTVNNLRLWAAKATRDFDLSYFHEGNYIKAVETKHESENISRVLYPADTTYMGRELRLKQEYFFVSASIQDIVQRFRKRHGDWNELPHKVAIQLNDTHPAVAIPELMRLLMDEQALGWDQAWNITTSTFAYTNHTLMPEALETWPVDLFAQVLPRHLQIIYEINHRLLKRVAHRFPGDTERLRRMSLIDEGGGRRIRMAHLAMAGSHTVNGVSQLHTELMKQTIFADFHQLEPEKIVSITNGVTPRRWLNLANPGLSRLIGSRIGYGWKSDLGQLERLIFYASDDDFLQAFRAVKHGNKLRLAALIEKKLSVTINTDSLFDVQIKRIHEYKRQLLNVLHVVTLYNNIRDGADTVPRTVVFGGKAAPGYYMAKLIIKLINDVADQINNDPLVGNRLKVAFIPNYNVTVATEIIPAADLSEQISLAGTEASGTGNMKLALNGALTIGTLDGANIEIRNQVEAENFFDFGLTAEQVAALRAQGYDPYRYYEENPELRRTLDMIGAGYFSPDDPQRFRPLVDSLIRGGDYFMVLADYAAYVETQQKVARLYREQNEWSHRAVLNVARMGEFSSDRAVQRYADKIWGIRPYPHD